MASVVLLLPEKKTSTQQLALSSRRVGQGNVAGRCHCLAIIFQPHFSELLKTPTSSWQIIIWDYLNNNHKKRYCGFGEEIRFAEDTLVKVTK